MLNFNCHITDIIDSQATTRKTSAFITYSTKKQIIEADKLTEEQKKFIKEIAEDKVEEKVEDTEPEKANKKNKSK